MTSFIPQICPISNKKSKTLECVDCPYAKNDKWSDTTWCNADRVERGLEPMYPLSERVGWSK